MPETINSFSEYLSDHSRNGKIIFLAANPDIPIKGSERGC